MSVRAMAWVWEHSTAGPTERLVLLAIADCANDAGQAWPSMAALVTKTRLSERTVQRAVQCLVEIGELAAVIGGGRGRTTKYRLVQPETPAEKPRNPDTPSGKPRISDEKPRQPVKETPSTTTVNPVTVTPGTIKNHQENRHEPSAVQPLSLTQRSKRITDAYASAEPMCKWPAVNGVVMKAIRAERWTDQEIRDALLRLAGEGRSVTVDTLRIELDGLPARASPTRSTTNDRVAAGLALAEQLERGEITT